MTTFWKLSLVALVSLIIFTPAVSHAQEFEGWDYDRVEALIEELEDFENTFEYYDEVNFDDVEDHYDEVLIYLEDFDIPEEQPVVVEAVSTSASVNNDYGTFTIRFDVSAIDDDFCVENSTSDDLGGGAEYYIKGAHDTGFTQSSVLISSADLKNNCFVVKEGDTETFSLTVTINPDETGPYAVGLRAVNERNNRIVIDKDDRDFLTESVEIPGDVTTKNTYRGYLDGKLFITTKNITEAKALENCKLNASKNTGKSIRCTWGTKEIYRVDLPTGTISTKSPLYTGSAHTISGTAKITPTVGLVISNGDKVYGSGPITVSSTGRWSVKVPELAAGTYTFTLYEEKDRVIASTKMKVVKEEPLVLPSTTDTTTVSPINEPLVLPAETSTGKTSSLNSNMSASAAVAFENLLKAFEVYFNSR